MEPVDVFLKYNVMVEHVDGGVHVSMALSTPAIAFRSSMGSNGSGFGPHPRPVERHSFPEAMPLKRNETIKRDSNINVCVFFTNHFSLLRELF